MSMYEVVIDVAKVQVVDDNDYIIVRIPSKVYTDTQPDQPQNTAYKKGNVSRNSNLKNNSSSPLQNNNSQNQPRKLASDHIKLITQILNTNPELTIDQQYQIMDKKFKQLLHSRLKDQMKQAVENGFMNQPWQGNSENGRNQIIGANLTENNRKQTDVKSDRNKLQQNLSANGLQSTSSFTYTPQSTNSSYSQVISSAQNQPKFPPSSSHASPSNQNYQNQSAKNIFQTGLSLSSNNNSQPYQNQTSSSPSAFQPMNFNNPKPGGNPFVHQNNNNNNNSLFGSMNNNNNVGPSRGGRNNKDKPQRMFS